MWTNIEHYNTRINNNTILQIRIVKITRTKITLCKMVCINMGQKIVELHENVFRK